ncbi:MAG: efflux RND transporter permease subunit [Nitrospirota bacterium]|nr:efflux RND transporter permease subunit [Nitrospirota bacterium]
MFLVKMSLKSPYTIIAMALAIVLMGAQSLSSMNVSILPRIPLPVVEVLTVFPGMNVYNTEMDITEQMERIILQAPYIRSVKSESLVGISMIQIRFRSSYSLSAGVSMVTSLVYSSLKYLPPGIFPPIIIPFGISAIPIADLVLSSKELTQMQMFDLGFFNVRSQMGTVPGVAAPPVFGGLSRQIQVFTNNTALLARGLTIWDVVNALNRQNIIWPAGFAKIGDMSYNVFVNALLGPVKTIGDVPIKVEHGQPVFIKDVAKARDSYRIQTNPVRVDGRKSVYIPVLKQEGANTVKVINATQNAIKTFYGLPKSLDISLVFDQSVYIRDSVSSLEREGLIGILLTAAMILLFLGNVRSTLIITTSIPLSLLVGFVMLNATGQTINIMTLGGLALAIGRLVDDAIVVLENTNRHLEMGKSPAQAALDGAGEVAMPVLASTIATMIVFSPVLFLLGKGKYLFTPLAAAVAYSMLASYFVSMTLVPVLSSWFLKPESYYRQSRSLFRRGVEAFNRFFDRFRNLYRTYLKIALHHRLPVSLLIFLAFVGSFFLFSQIGSEYFPPDDTGAFIIQLRLPVGSRIEKTDAISARVDAAIRRIIPAKDIVHVVINEGVRPGWDAMYTTNLWAYEAFALVQLVPSDKRNRSMWDFEHDLRPYLVSHFPNVEFYFASSSIITQILSGSGEAPIDIQLLGPSYRTLGTLAHKIVDHIRTLPGTTDVRVKQNIHYPSMYIDVDRSKAQFLGVSELDVERNVITSLVTNVAIGENFWVDQTTGNPYFLTAQYPEDKINSMDALSNILVRQFKGSDFAQSGSVDPPIYLRDIATIKRITIPPAIFHYNVQRVVDILVNVTHDPGVSLGGVGNRIDDYLAHFSMPEGYSWRESGMLASMHRSFGSMGLAVMLAMALVYLALVAQFQSFLDPFIIMMSVPFGLIGVFSMLYATGTGINVESLIGVIMDIGIGVSNSVLLVEFAIRLREQGAPLYRAVVEAGATRLRPILMTAIGTILAMIPTAIGMGVGSGAEEPLARAVIGGLMVMTILTLVQVPIFYVILHTWEERWKTRTGPVR